MATTNDIRMTVRMLANRAADEKLKWRMTPGEMEVVKSVRNEAYYTYRDAAKLVARMLLDKQPSQPSKEFTTAAAVGA